MATAGSGDVLTGIMVGLMAQKLLLEKDGDLREVILEPALAGVCIHGLTGDLTREEKGEMGMIAGDMMEKTPEALLRTVSG
jgi:NAD(P)H-hydrate epimerase